ncbi:uncharacterized protein LOC118197988 [Stegodyphus dumicola]|uniref:uncharacterized protein LOC118197988 n=1 Tax=Stegodyphus dumicola TaxID=202533 RepID=UPI0015AD773D|nr:uncharacterized protein LOC118197988 [Stegodyphus dumicola]
MNLSYQDPAHVASFGGVEALHRAAGGKVSRKEIQTWLEGIDAYTLHKPIRRKFPTNRVIVYSIDQQWQADLVDVSHLRDHNDGYRYILTCIDILSKYAWAIPLKQKRGEDIVKAFQKIMSQHVLDKLIESYNATFHSSIKRAPIEVNSENESDVWFTLYEDHPSNVSKCIFAVGDVVRVSKLKLTFEKGYETNWTEELFVVTECVKRHPAMYRIKDLLGDSVKGTFYAQELQKVRLKDQYRIEKILKKRMRKKQTEYFVKYRGYPDKFNQWIPASNLLSI